MSPSTKPVEEFDDLFVKLLLTPLPLRMIGVPTIGPIGEPLRVVTEKEGASSIGLLKVLTVKYRVSPVSVLVASPSLCPWSNNHHHKKECFSIFTG